MIRLSGKKKYDKRSKRILACALVGCMVFNYAGDVGEPVVWAEQTEIAVVGEYADEQGLEYILYEDGTCGVSWCDISCVKIKVPETITTDRRTYSVTKIEHGAFWECSNLTSVEIPDSVKLIEDWTFVSCDRLTSVNIPASVTSIGEYVFGGCSSLTDIPVSEDNTSYMSLEGVLYTKSGGTLICCPEGKKEINQYPANLTSIGDFAFEYCSNLNNVSIPDSVTSIGNFTFSNCSGLTSVSIPDNVTFIGNSAFQVCDSLININIPAEVTYIGDNAFTCCINLENIIVDDSNSNYMSMEGVLYTKTGDTLICCPGGKKEITKYPTNLTSIKGDAFWYCQSLNSINIPNGVTCIGSCAFSECKNLININIPESVTSIGESAFSDCRSLINITIPNSVTSIGKGVFCGCENLNSIIIPKNVTSIGDKAFYGCDNLVIYGAAGSIAETYAKGNNISFAEYEFEATPTPAPTESVAATTNPAPTASPELVAPTTVPTTETPIVTEPIITQPTPTPVATVKKPAAKNSVLTDTNNKCKVTVTSASGTNPTVAYTKSTNENAASIKVPDTVKIDGITYKVTSVAANAFANNKKLTKVTIGKNVTVIGKNAFKNCTKLKSVTIQSTGLKTIGADAFSGDKKLTTITLKSTKLTSKSISKTALKGTNSKLVIKVPAKKVSVYSKYFKNKGNTKVKVTKL